MSEQPLTLLVGIDLAKDSFTAALSHPEVDVVPTFGVDAEGFEAFRQFLAQHGRFPDDFVVGLESSGPYTVPLLSWLVNQGLRTHLIQPLLIHRYRKGQSLRQVKTDVHDARLIVRYMAQAEELPAPIQELEEARPLAQEYEQLAQQIAAVKNELRQVLHALFPELASRSAVFSRYLLTVLGRFPSAHAVRQAPRQELEAFWREACSHTGKPPALTCQRFRQLAMASVGMHSPSRELILQIKITLLQQLIGLQEQLRQTLAQVVRKAAPRAWQSLTSVPGLGHVTSALFLAQIHSIDRFASHQQLVAYAGIDPVVYQSGQYVGQSYISKRGSPHLRRTLYLMAQGVIRYTETFRAYFESLRQRGKPYRVAVIATANKLLRVLFALLKSGSTFQDNYHASVSNS